MDEFMRKLYWKRILSVFSGIRIVASSYEATEAKAEEKRA